MDVISQKPLAERINFRLIGFLAVVATPFVALAYGYIRHEMDGGIVQRNGFAEVDLKSLGNFPFNENTGTIEDVPQLWRKLDGKRVQLQGFMFAGRSSAPRVANFEFVYNVAICCFGVFPLVQERVYARTPPGKSLPFYGGAIRLTGILHVDVKREREAGTLQSIYTLDIEDSEPVQ